MTVGMPEGTGQQTPVCPSAHHPSAVIGFVHGRESGYHHLISRLSVPHRAYMGILILFRHDFIVLRQQPMPGLQHHKPNPGFLVAVPIGQRGTFSCLCLMTGMVCEQQFFPGRVLLVIFQVFIQQPFCKSFGHPPPDISVIHTLVNGMAVAAETPQDMTLLTISLSDPFPVTIGILLRHGLREHTACPVVSNHQLAPDRQQEHIESIFLRFIQDPVQISKVLLVESVQVAVFQCRVPGRRSHLHIPFRIQRHNL